MKYLLFLSAFAITLCMDYTPEKSVSAKRGISIDSLCVEEDSDFDAYRSAKRTKREGELSCSKAREDGRAVIVYNESCKGSPNVMLDGGVVGRSTSILDIGEKATFYVAGEFGLMLANKGLLRVFKSVKDTISVIRIVEGGICTYEK